MNDVPRSRPAFGLNRWDWSSPTAFANDVRRAEQLSWDYAFIPVNPLALWDPYVLLACAAQCTSQIGLGTLIENAVLDHPVSAASSIATLDALSNGRALLGYGIGDTAVRYLGRSPATVKEMESALLTVKRFLRGEPVDIEGGRRMSHARSVPVWMAAGGPRTLRMCGRIADGVFVRVGRHPDNLRHAVEQVHAGATEAGRDPNEVRIALIFHTTRTSSSTPAVSSVSCRTRSRTRFHSSAPTRKLRSRSTTRSTSDSLSISSCRTLCHRPSPGNPCLARRPTELAATTT
jgi:alkanesulfonate monooxygenase SsuD/methylene tetrahydromethanopterin reductase-like flavin-dependent oxidoreductase (luciferase family)